MSHPVGSEPAVKRSEKMQDRKKVGLLERHVYLLVSVAFAISLAASTGIVSGPQGSGFFPDGPNPSSNSILALNFTLQDGDDTEIRGDVYIGEQLHAFEPNGTMFLNQTYNATRGINGYNLGEDIFNVSWKHTGEGRNTISGETVEAFSADERFLDGGNMSDGSFQGGNATHIGEAIIRDNDSSSPGVLDSSDFVVVNGTANVSDFGSNVVYADSDGDGSFYGDIGADAIIRNSASGDAQKLEDSDTVLKPGEGLSVFDSTFRFADDSPNDTYEDGNAIVDESGGSNSGILEGTTSGGPSRDLGDSDADRVIQNGAARLVSADNSRLAFFDPDNSGFSVSGDYPYSPVYHEGDVQDFTVNASKDTRIGPVTVKSFSDSDPTTLNLGLETMKFVNETASGVADNDVGKSLYNTTAEKTGYAGEGLFYVIELEDTEPTDGEWNPGGGDQELLIYDFDSGTDVSTGETLLFNSDPANDNVSIKVGEEFESSLSLSTNTYEPGTADLGYLDNGSGKFEMAADNVSVNISTGGGNRSIVNLAPHRYNNTLNGSGDFNGSKGVVRFWNASRSPGEEVEDGLYVDTDNSSNVSSGDVRLGEWSYDHVGDTVEQGDLDVGATLSAFSSSEAAFLDADDSGTYSPGTGNTAGQVSDSGGREAIIDKNSDSDSTLDSYDIVIRAGSADLEKFEGQSPGIRYYDADGSGNYQTSEAIVRNTGSQAIKLEDGDTVVTSGGAALTDFNASERYVETGVSPGFEKGSSEAIIYDAGQDGKLRRGILSRGVEGDHVIAAGNANLEKFAQPPEQENDSGLAYVDRTGESMFNRTEDILNLTMVTNGSDSQEFNGTKILNFADSTVHNGSSHYMDGDAIVNDTDENTVFRDVLKSLEIGNTAGTPESYQEKISDQELEDGQLELFLDDGDEVFDRNQDEKIASLTGSGTTLSASGISQNISRNGERFFVSFNATEVSRDVVLHMRGSISSMNLAGNQDLSGLTSSETQKIDSYPPQYVGGNTGPDSQKNRSYRKAVVLSIKERGTGVVPSSVNDLWENGSFKQDFEILREGVSITREDVKSNSNNILLNLSEPLPTNATPRVNVTGSFQDGAASKIQSGIKELDDHLKPLVDKVRYQDENADARIDEVEVFFSENISYGSFESQDWGVTDNNISSFEVNAGNVTNSFRLELNASAEENVTGTNATEPELNFSQLGNTVHDLNGNSLSDVSNVEMVDDAGPAIVSAETFDPDSDSRVESMSISFSENISDSISTINRSAFNLSRGSIESVSTVISNDSMVELDVTSLDTASTPNVTLHSGYVYDFHGNTVAKDQNFTSTTDGAKPVLLHASVEPIWSNSTETVVRMKFSEEVRDLSQGNGDGVILNGKNLEFVNTTLDDIHYANYSDLLKTGELPNVTSAPELVDSEGNSVALKGGEEVTVSTFRRQVYKGWNMVSFPIADETNPQINETLNTSKVHIIWSYVDGEWRSYDPDAPSNDFTRFQGGIGYLINASEDFVLEPNVNSVWRGQNQGGVGFDRASAPINDGGWSLVGQFQEYVQVADGVTYLNSSRKPEVVSDPTTLQEKMWKAPALGDPKNGGNIGPVYAPDIQLIGPNTIANLDTRKIKPAQGPSDWFMFPGTAYWVKIDNVDSWTWNSVSN